MAENDFVLAVPDGWTEVENATMRVEQEWGGFAQMQESIRANEWTTISNYLEASGLIPDNAVILEARIFDTGAGGTDYVRFWYRI